MNTTRRAGLLLVLLVLALVGCGGDNEPIEVDMSGDTRDARPAGVCGKVEAPDPKEDGGQQAPSEALDASKTYRLLVSTSCGLFTIELDLQTAPKTAVSLVSLAKAGFFDGTIFHRVVPGFVIQGGDPTGTGTGGPGYKTVDAPPANAKYTKGIVAMAKAGFEAPGTAGSQFFVVTGADVGLPPEYAIVGKVTDGIESVSAIDRLGVEDGPPSQPVVIESVTVEEG